MKEILRTKRLITAAALFLVVWSTSVGAAGAEKDIEGNGGPLPSSFTLAEERVGDAAQYELAIVRVKDDGAEVLEEHPIAGIEWMEPQWTRGHDDRLYDTNRVHQWGWQKDDDGQWGMYAQPVWAVDKASRQIVAYSYMHNSDLQITRSRSQHLLGPEDNHVIPCGVANAYSGRAVPLDRGVVFFRDCAWPNYWSPGESFRAVATQRLGDHDTVLFTQDGRMTIHMWFQEDVPYPVRVASQDQDDAGLWHVHRLTLFHRGEGPIISWDGAPPAPAEMPLKLAPRVDGLYPEEAGVAHPFPLSTALKASRSSANATRFWEILDNGGYLARGQAGLARIGEDPVSRQWSFLATDGTALAAIAVLQETTPSPTPRPLWPYAPGLEEVGRATTVRVVTQEAQDVGFPKPEQVPADWPTVAFLFARWQTQANAPYRDMPADAWGFFVTCADYGGCENVRMTFEAGVNHQESTREPSDSPLLWSSASDTYHSIYEMSVDPLRGNSSNLWEFHFDEEGGTGQDGVEGEPLPPFTTAQLRSAHEVTTFSRLAWVAPAAPWVAAGGAVAFVATAAYLLWPVLKTGALGLFSRMTGPEELARHPVRSRILAIVDAEPGVHVRELARRLGTTRNGTDHHVRRLQQAGLVTVVAGNGYSCVFRRGTVEDGLMRAAEPLKAEGARAILALAVQAPGIGVREAAARLGMSPGTASHHLRKLRGAGLLLPGPGIASTDLGRRAAPAPA